MHLKTMETHASLALALVPPGNVLRDLATIRGRLFTVDGLQGSRAWFDFPVLAWLGRCPDGGSLATIAATLQLPLEFGTPQWEDTFLAMPIPAGFDAAALPELSRWINQAPRDGRGTNSRSRTGTGSDRWFPGPFPAGKGLICAALDPGAADGVPARTLTDAVLAQAIRLAGQAPRATVYSLALVELHWYPGPEYGSS